MLNPESETRLENLIQRFKSEKLHVPDHILHLLDAEIAKFTRSFEDSLINSRFTLDLAKKLMSEKTPAKPNARSTVENIINAVAAHYGVTFDDIKSTSRRKDLFIPRSVAIFLCRKHTGHTYNSIGKEFGGRDTSTIICSFNKVENKLANDAKLKADIISIEKQLLI